MGERHRLSYLVKFVDTHELHLRIANRYLYTDFRAARERFEAGDLLGKVLVTF